MPISDPAAGWVSLSPIFGLVAGQAGPMMSVCVYWETANSMASGAESQKSRIDLLGLVKLHVAGRIAIRARTVAGAG